MRGKWILATALTLVFAVGARADNVTTQITLQPPFTGTTSPISALVNKSTGEGAGLSYTTATGTAPGNLVTATGAVQLTSFQEFNGTVGQFQNMAIVETYAIQGHQVTPVGGAAFTAKFDVGGVVAIYAVPLNTFNPQNTATWGTGTTPLYTATLQEPAQVTVKGPNGDQTFAGQPAAGQLEASFFPSTGVSSAGAFPIVTLSNPGTLFTPPMPFNGFQGEIKETNSLTGPYTSNPTPLPTNAQLDANFAALAALAPNLNLTLGQFTANNYTGTAGTSGSPNTLQKIGVTQYPFLTSGVPEPSSILLLSIGALGIGFYARRQKKALQG